MQINPAPLHLAQSVLVGLSLALSIAILGTAAHTLAVFNKQQSSNPWWLPLWPQHFDVHGTKGLVGSAATVTILSIAFLVAALVPKFNLLGRPTLRALLGLGTAFPSALITLITLIYAHILNSDAPEIDTIQTWTCKYKGSSPLEQDIPLPKGMGNGNFGSLCQQSKFTLYGTLVVCLLTCGSVVLTFVTWLASKWAGRQSRKEMEMAGQQS
ncbi:hypothetical protein P154DRAFT_447374 [Amniculicola lignicola CBS 123094]|uniref:MARVEL domain-containing protein n=1 Tax=Amniculicola lignicola CBS 123094 TaxID=1392246 RepID=A0A6A5W043_9PLEO|nr:hypothetical protein P154DRAFT_447374 [Amniculicola lignicola CBS 123094]